MPLETWRGGCVRCLWMAASTALKSTFPCGVSNSKPPSPEGQRRPASKEKDVCKSRRGSAAGPAAPSPAASSRAHLVPPETPQEPIGPNQERSAAAVQQVEPVSSSLQQVVALETTTLGRYSPPHTHLTH